MKFYFSITLILFISFFSYAQTDTEYQITGNICEKEFYGSPNYGETPAIDQIERCYVLTPLNEIRYSNNDRIENLQLIIEPNKDNFSFIKENRIFYCEGIIKKAETGHHHTEYIFLVRNIIPLEELKKAGYYE